MHFSSDLGVPFLYKISIENKDGNFIQWGRIGDECHPLEDTDGPLVEFKSLKHLQRHHRTVDHGIWNRIQQYLHAKQLEIMLPDFGACEDTGEFAGSFEVRTLEDEKKLAQGTLCDPRMQAALDSHTNSSLVYQDDTCGAGDLDDHLSMTTQKHSHSLLWECTASPPPTAPHGIFFHFLANKHIFHDMLFFGGQV